MAPPANKEHLLFHPIDPTGWCFRPLFLNWLSVSVLKEVKLLGSPASCSSPRRHCYSLGYTVLRGQHWVLLLYRTPQLLWEDKCWRQSDGLFRAPVSRQLKHLHSYLLGLVCVWFVGHNLPVMRLTVVHLLLENWLRGLWSVYTVQSCSNKWFSATALLQQ